MSGPRRIASSDVTVSDGIGKRQSKTKGVRFRVRWSAALRDMEAWHGSRADALAYRNRLQAARGRGEEWVLVGAKYFPVSELVRTDEKSVLDMALRLVELEWEHVWAPAHRYQRVACLAQVVSLLVDNAGLGVPGRHEIRRVLDRVVLPPTGRPDRIPAKELTPARVVEVEAWVRAHSLPVRELTVAVVTDCLLTASRKIRGGRYAAHQLTQQRTALSRVCDMAVDTKLLDRNPVSDSRAVVKAPGVRPARREQLPTIDQAREIVDAVCRRADRKNGTPGAVDPARTRRYRAFLTVLWSAGVRPSELVGLRLGPDVVLDGPAPSLTMRTPTTTKGSMWMDDPGAGRTYEDRPKLKARDPGQVRVLPLIPEAVGALRTHIADNEIAVGDRMFTNSTGRPLDPSNAGRVWRTGLGRVRGHNWEGLTMYQLRHTAGTSWADGGMGVNDIAAMLGNSVAVAGAVYLRQTDGADARRRAILAQVVATTPNG